MAAILPIPCLADNYAWALVDGGAAIVIDPGEANAVRAKLAACNLALAAIWLTHHHYDHIGGVEALAAGRNVAVLGAAADRHRLPRLNRGLVDGDRVATAALGDAQVLAVPGHTLGAIAFYLPGAQALFTGDTLFLGGCGRLFEGTPAMMQASLARLGALPAATNIYCGHEYTERNYAFAHQLEPAHPAIAQRLAEARARRASGAPTVPATVAQERAASPFLRLEDPALRARVGGADAVQTLAFLRRQRDAF